MLPQKNSLTDSFMQSLLMMEGQNTLSSYHTLQTPPKPILPEPIFMDYMITQQYVPIQQNYLDNNANSKIYERSYPDELVPVIPNNKSMQFATYSSFFEKKKETKKQPEFACIQKSKQLRQQRQLKNTSPL